jgi:predicted enzyme related to lactoylglutathione lyase
MKIKMVSVPVKSPVDAHKFYTEKLGFVSKMFMPEAYVAIVASSEDPEGTGLLLEPSENTFYKTFQEEVYKAGMPIIVFGVTDVQKEYEKLKSRGIVFKKPPTKNEWGTEAIFDDTCGNYIQIHQS